MTSVTVVVPMTIRRRGGRKQIIGPDGEALRSGGETQGVTSTRGGPTLVKAMARAFRWRRMLEEGRHASIRDLAKAEDIDRRYVGRVLNFTLLAPDLVEAILAGRAPATLDMATLMAGCPARWDEQRACR